MTVLFDEKRIQELHDAALRRKYIAEGEARGEAKGEARGVRNVAREMLLKNVPVSTIVEFTKMTAESVNNLARSLDVTPVA